ncbi:MAG TPA: hypothetical protein VKT75_06930 [Acidobacteriaceae bacterium]|nr:hypothetical protein [Acidobacteriaceae bacterium]
MKAIRSLGTVAILCAAVLAAAAQSDSKNLIVTASNTSPNNVLVYDTSGRLLDTIATGGNGGVSGNAGGIATAGNRVAVVNFASQNISVLRRTDAGLHLDQVIPAASSPVSVAFGHGHLYILGTTTIESHPTDHYAVAPGADGLATLLKADGSAAQVGVLENQLIATEKSNTIETVNLAGDGAVSGAPSLVSNIPSNVNAPFGLITRDNQAYVTIAHANEISLVRHDSVITTTGSGTQSAPCWLALDGPWLFSANSPSMSLSRYLVYGSQIVQVVPVAASFNGAPTDIAYRSGWLAAIDGSGAVSHLSIFRVDWDGNLIRQSQAIINAPANGVVVIGDDD